MEPNFTEPPNAQRSDEELVKLAQSGDIESGNLLFTRHESELMGYAKSRCWGAPDREETAKDILQEANLRAWMQFSEVRRNKFVRWIKRIIKNVAYENWRLTKKGINNFGTEHGPKDIDNIEDRRSETIGDKLDRRDFEELLGNLPKQLADLEQCYQQIGRVMLERLRNGEEALSSDEIAQRTGIPRRSVYRYRDTIEKRWKRLCEKRGFDPSLVENILGKKKNESV